MTEPERDRLRDAQRTETHDATQQMLKMLQSAMATVQTHGEMLADVLRRIGRLEGENRAQNKHMRSEEHNIEELSSRLDQRTAETQAQLDQWGSGIERRLESVERRIGKPLDPKILVALIGLVGPVMTAAAVVFAAWWGAD